MNPSSPSSFLEPAAGQQQEEAFPRLFNFSLDCSTRVKKTPNQSKPVLFLNRSEWYTMHCQQVQCLAPGARVRMCLGFSCINPNLRQMAQQIFSKYQHVHPHERLVEVRLRNQDGETVTHSSGERFASMLWFALPLHHLSSSQSASHQQQQQSGSGHLLQSFEFSFRLNFVATQFNYCKTENHPLKMPFDFALYLITMVEGSDQSFGADFFPIRMTWPGRASPLSASIQARYDEYQSLKIPKGPTDITTCPPPASTISPSMPLLAYILQLPSIWDQSTPVSYVNRSRAVYLEIKPRMELEHALHRTTIVLGRHRSTHRSTNPLVNHIEFNHRFVIEFERSRLSEVVFDVYYDQRNNAIEIIWIPVKTIEVCFHFVWNGPLSVEVANAKVKFIVETTKFNYERFILEHATCLLKFTDNELDETDEEQSSSSSNSPIIVHKRKRRLSNSTQLTLPKHRNTRAPPLPQDPNYFETYEAFNHIRRR